jgi:hypothetical protein
VKFEWIEEHEKGFIHSKTFLTSALVINIVDLNKKFECARMFAKRD